jgi:2-haloacid dehalogenase
MKRHYPWLWFDADGTLFDFDRAEGIALKQTLESINAIFADEYLSVYRAINQKLWLALERHEISPAVLQVRRFEILLETLHLTGSPARISAAYLENLALCTDLIDGAYAVLATMRTSSRIAIVTNGLQAVQVSRLAHSKIRDFVSDLIISEQVGAAKPKAAFFDAAFARAGNPLKEDILLIGDSVTSDMQGGVEYGLATCWYNPVGAPRPDDLAISYEIAHLADLLQIIE